MVYLAQVLGSEAFGVIGLAAGILLYVGRLADGGLDVGLGVQMVAEAPDRARKLAPTLLLVRLSLAIVLALLLAAIGHVLLPDDEARVLAAYGLLLLPIALGTRWIHLGLERTGIVALSRAAGELVMVTLVVALVRGPEDLLRVPIAQMIGDGICALILFLWLPRLGFHLSRELDWSAVRRLVPRALPLVGGSLLALLIYNADLIMLRIFRDSSTVGFYVAAYALISFLGNLSTAYATALLPTLTRLETGTNEQRELFGRASAHGLALSLPITVGGMILAPEIIGLVFSAEYAPATLPLRVLLWTATLGVQRDVAIGGLMAAGRESWILRTNAWAAAFNVVGNVLLIPGYGMVGAASATLATEVLRLVIVFHYARRERFEMSGVATAWRPVVSVIAMAAVLLAAPGLPIWLAIPLGAVGYGVAMLVTGGLRFEGGRPLLKT